MELTEKRKQFIRDMANDEWVDNIKVDEKEFDRLAREMKQKTADFLEMSSDPTELHYFVDYYNWDKEDEESFIAKVLRNPNCDLSTVRMIFWRGSPSYYQKFAERSEVADWAKPGWDLLVEIIDKINSGQYNPATISYDPFDPVERDAKELDSTEAKWSIPSLLKEACKTDS